VLVPFVLEFVPTIDIEAKVVVITPPAGLFELLDSTGDSTDEEPDDE